MAAKRPRSQRAIGRERVDAFSVALTSPIVPFHDRWVWLGSCASTARPAPRPVAMSTARLVTDRLKKSYSVDLAWPKCANMSVRVRRVPMPWRPRWWPAADALAGAPLAAPEETTSEHEAHVVRSSAVCPSFRRSVGGTEISCYFERKVDPFHSALSKSAKIKKTTCTYVPPPPTVPSTFTHPSSVAPYTYTSTSKWPLRAGPEKRSPNRRALPSPGGAGARPGVSPPAASPPPAPSGGATCSSPHVW